MRLRWTVALLVAIGVLFLLRDTAAQPVAGRLTGVVRDQAGAIVRGARVTASERASGRQWHGVTNEHGRYAFVVLPPGTYRVAATYAGFMTSAVAGIVLGTQQVAEIDVVLEMGRVEQVVEVTAARAALRGGASSVVFSVGDREVAALPTIGHNPLALLLLAPGAVSPEPATFTDGARSTGGDRPFVNGNRREANSFQLDGMDANQTTENVVAYVPSPDAIEEIAVTTNNASADVGNYQGGLVHLTLKSGTNEIRGSAFGFIRDESLNAGPWRPRPPTPDPLNPYRKPPSRQSVVGGSAGGPLLRDRLFWFGSYHRAGLDTGPFTGGTTVITAAMRRGDFSALLQGPDPQQLFDPLTSRPDPADAARVIRDPFPGNQIPIERMDPVAAALFASPFYPAPPSTQLTDNSLNRQTSSLHTQQFDMKLDGKPSSRDDVSGRYSQSLQRIAVANDQPILMGSEDRSPFRSAAVRWVRQVRDRIVVQALAGFTRVVLRSDGGADVGGIGNLGETLSIPEANRLAPGLPAIAFGSASPVGSAKVVQQSAVNTFQYQGDLTWHRSAHLIKAGGLAIRYQQNVYFSGNTGQLGTFEFDGQYTRDPGDPRSTGSGIADFFLGFPRRVARGDYAGTWGHRSTLLAGFVQDDWRVGDALTLNLGVRYEYRTPFVEVHDRQVNFDLHTGQALFAGKDGNRRALYEPYANDWQPRAGVIWRPTLWRETLLLRAAYGISSFLEGTGTNLRLTLNPPFFNEFERINGDPAVLGARISEGFVGLAPKDPLSGAVLRAWDPQHRPARSEQWNVTVEARPTEGTTVAVGYVGQRGRHLVVPVNANQRRTPDSPRPFDAVYPQIGSVILTAPNARQRYDALQVSASRHWSHGWSILGSYTWGHAFNSGRGFFSAGGQTAQEASFWPNPYDPDAEWGPAGFDVRHSIAVAGLADLPWGSGRRWLSHGPRWVDALVGGWSVAAILRGHSGFGVTPLAPDQSRTGARSGRPDRVGDGRGPRQVGFDGFWFDPKAFVLPARGTFGNAGVGIIRGPGMRVVDLALSRRQRLHGTLAVEIRADVSNLFNTPVFHAPVRDLTNPNFGRVLAAQLSREIQLGVRVIF